MDFSGIAIIVSLYCMKNIHKYLISLPNYLLSLMTFGITITIDLAKNVTIIWKNNDKDISYEISPIHNHLTTKPFYERISKLEIY